MVEITLKKSCYGIRWRTVIVIASLLFAGSPAWAQGTLDLVNTLQGTDSKNELSHGNTLPLVGMPWGMTDWSPQTGTGAFYFQFAGTQINGFRATHEPSPWMNDYGWFTIMPQVGPLDVGVGGRASDYDVSQSIFRPDYLKINLKKYDIATELTATERCGAFRFTFARGDSGRLIVEPGGHSSIQIVGRTVHGFTKVNSGGASANFASYFFIEFDRDLTATGTYVPNATHPGDKAIDANSAGAYVEFDIAQKRTVDIRIGTSFISAAQAERNLRAETEGGFEGMHQRAAVQWQKNLDKIEIKGATTEQRATFYTCLYRAQMFPHRLYELNESGKPVHYSPYDGQVHDGVLYGDNGFWDTYRTVYPLYAILFPTQLAEILQGYISAYKEGGWFPEWPSPGYRNIMIGSHIDAVFADAISKGIKNFDVDTAYEAMRKDAYTASRNRGLGRAGLQQYLSLGYVPEGTATYSLSTSLDYAYDDWCVAQVARELGKMDDYSALIARSENYRKLFDPSVGFMRAKRADGSWAGDFDQFAWGGPYVEGGPWQCTWAVQHDPDGLAELMGGKVAMAQKLDQMLGLPPVFHTGGYGKVIHEMAEMAIATFGQYDQGNQPGHHVLYLFTSAGQPWKTEYWTRRVCRDLFNSGPDGFAGDEDNGEMSSWYILSSLGIYSLCPGQPTYVLTSPLFDQATIHLENGRTFVIDSPGNSTGNTYVASRQLNGSNYTNTWIPYQAIASGGTLKVQLSSTPNLRELAPEEYPYSLSRELKQPATQKAK
jgi:predicted alpha-1,2-mannosidase